MTGVLVMPISGTRSKQFTSLLGTVFLPAAGAMKLACQSGAEFVLALVSASKA